MNANIVINFEKVNGINPERPDLLRERDRIMKSAKKMIDSICKALEDELRQKQVETKIIYTLEYGN